MTITINGTGTVTGANTLTNTNTVTSAAATALTLQSAGTTAVTIDTSQNVGIGLTNPSAYGKLSIVAAAASTAFYAGSSTQGVYISNSTGTDVVYDASGNLAGAHVWKTGNVERARIDSNGRMQINTTAPKYSATLTIVKGGNSYNITSSVTATGSQGHMVFENNNADAVGTIFTNGSSTAYNTSSDYRLKNTIAPMTGALAKVALLKPVTYKWNVDNSVGQGFIAHELAEVEPGCVTGEKDAVDAEGKPQYQGIDVSFLVATLTAAIQELKAIIDTQATRITALENK